MGPDDEVAVRVDRELAAFLDERVAQLVASGPELAPLAEAARRGVLSGGKRLRPRFAYWGWRSIRPAGDDDTAVLTAAAAIELVHGSALVHDDLMDGSDTRRGRPSSHRAFAGMHRDSGWPGDRAAFASAATILLGDLLLTWSDVLFARAGLPPQSRRVFDDLRQVVVAGQYLEVLLQARGGFDAADALRVAAAKTAGYTVEGPLHLGATAAGARPEALAALSAYARPLGEAFQLRDDVLGVFGDPRRTGKPAGDDLREGKRTLLVALAMAAARPGRAAALEAGLGDRDLDDARLEQLRAVIVESGALDEVETRIARRTQQARAALDGPELRADARAALDALALAATSRSS